VGPATPINRVVLWGPRDAPGSLPVSGLHPVEGLVRSTIWTLLIHSLGSTYAQYKYIVFVYIYIGCHYSSPRVMDQ
jgi:hypothetical protein